MTLRGVKWPMEESHDPWRMFFQSHDPCCFSCQDHTKGDYEKALLSLVAGDDWRWLLLGMQHLVDFMDAWRGMFMCRPMGIVRPISFFLRNITGIVMFLWKYVILFFISWNRDTNCHILQHLQRWFVTTIFTRMFFFPASKVKSFKVGVVSLCAVA